MPNNSVSVVNAVAPRYLQRIGSAGGEGAAGVPARGTFVFQSLLREGWPKAVRGSSSFVSQLGCSRISAQHESGIWVPGLGRPLIIKKEEFGVSLAQFIMYFTK